MSTAYITLEDGVDFRAIARYMSSAGYSMNHATARNVMMAGMGKLIGSTAAKLGKSLTEEELFTLLKTQQTYDNLQEVLQVAHNQLVEEGRLPKPHDP